MNKLLRYSFVALMAMIFGNVSAQEFVFDFTDEANPWNFPTEQFKETGSFTKDGKTLVITTTNYTRWFSDTKVLLFGKKDATITLPAFDFDVERIDIVGASGASGKVTFNIFVGDEAVSTEVTGAKETAIFNIAEGKQAAGTVYVIKNTNDNNNQISKILIWKKGTSGDTPEPTHIANTAETAYTVAKAFELIDAGEALSETVFVKGIVSQVDSYNETYSSITYWISDDGTTTNQLEVYSGKGLDGAGFASVDDVKVGATVIVKGILKKYKEIYEFDKNNELVSYSAPSSEAGQVWDFTVLPTQAIDGTGNIETNVEGGILPEDGGESWSAFYNKDAIDGAEFMNKAGETLELTKGLKWYINGAKKVYYRNYPVESGGKPYGGKYIFINDGDNSVEICVPAEVGQQIEIIASTAKNNKKITSQDVAETFETTEGETLHGVVIDGTTNYDWKPYTLTVTAKNPFLKFEKNACIQKITVKDATGISVAKSNVKANNGVIYNLAGQKVGKDYKGIVIMNGKKMIQK